MSESPYSIVEPSLRRSQPKQQGKSLVIDYRESWNPAMTGAAIVIVAGLIAAALVFAPALALARQNPSVFTIEDTEVAQNKEICAEIDPVMTSAIELCNQLDL